MLNLILTFKSTFLVSPYTSRPTLLPSPTFPVSLYQRTHPIAKSYILRIPPPADPPYCSVLHIFPVSPYQPTHPIAQSYIYSPYPPTSPLTQEAL